MRPAETNAFSTLKHVKVTSHKFTHLAYYFDTKFAFHILYPRYSKMHYLVWIKRKIEEFIMEGETVASLWKCIPSVNQCTGKQLGGFRVNCSVRSVSVITGLVWTSPVYQEMISQIEWPTLAPIVKTLSQHCVTAGPASCAFRWVSKASGSNCFLEKQAVTAVGLCAPAAPYLIFITSDYAINRSSVKFDKNKIYETS